MKSKTARIITYISIFIIVMCICFNIYLYTQIKSPVFKSLISARIIGTDERNIFVEMTWEMDNTSKVPYQIEGSELYFYEGDQQIARVYFAEEVAITALSNTILKVSASIQRATFQRLMTNYIDQYSFHLVGHIKTSIIFIPVYLELNKHIPVDIKDLINRFITDSFKNSVSVDEVRLVSERNNHFMHCNVSILNRAKLEIGVRALTANVEINRNIVGVIDFFEPFQFKYYESHRTSPARFLFPNPPIDLSSMRQFRYRIYGQIQVELWDRIYHFPVEMLGEY